MKRIISIAVIFCLIFSLCGCSEEEKYPNHTEAFFVNDFADVMNEEDESTFLGKAQALSKATEAQVVIVTVEDLNGDEPYEYATEIGRKWGVGSEEKDDGIVILLSRDDREIFVAVGYGLEGDLPDSKTGRIIDIYGLPYLRADNFSKGLLGIGNALVNEVYLAYGLEPEQGYINIENAAVPEETEGGKVAISWIILFIILLCLSFISRRRGGGLLFFGMPHSGGFYHGGGGFRGGGGGFSGGGGSFGGGGAGRGF